jgi:WD40 repeat protein
MLLYSPDGRWLAAATSGGVTLYDAVSLKQVWSAKTIANLSQIAFSPQGETLSGVDTAVRLYQWQVSDGKQLLAKIPEDINELPMSFALSPDGSKLYVPAYDDSIHIYQVSDASLTGKLEQFLSLGETIIKLAVSPDTKRMASISINGDIRLWSLSDRKMRGVLKFDKTHRPENLMFSPDGKLLVNFSTRDGQRGTRLLDVPSQTWGQTIPEEIIAVSADKFLLSFSAQGIELRKFGSEQIVQTLPEHDRPQGKAASSPDGAFLAVGTSEGIHIWQRAQASLAGSIPGRYPNYSRLAVTADGQKMAAGSLQGIEILNGTDGSALRVLPLPDGDGAVSELVFSPAGDLLAGAMDESVYVWNVETGSVIWKKGTDDTLSRLAFSANGAMLAGVYSQSTNLSIGQTVPGLISVWDANNGQELQQLEGEKQLFTPGYTSLAFSADGMYMLAGQDGGDIEIWLVEDWSRDKTISSDSLMGWNPQLAFSPDGKWFISGGMDRQVQIWKMPEGTSAKKATTGESTIKALVYSPDGKLIALNALNDIELRGGSSGAYLCKLSGSTDEPAAIFFSADQRSIISLAEDGVVRIWGLP